MGCVKSYCGCVERTIPITALFKLAPVFTIPPCRLTRGLHRGTVFFVSDFFFILKIIIQVDLIELPSFAVSRPIAHAPDPSGSHQSLQPTCVYMLIRSRPKIQPRSGSELVESGCKAYAADEDRFHRTIFHRPHYRSYVIDGVYRKKERRSLQGSGHVPAARKYLVRLKSRRRVLVWSPHLLPLWDWSGL